MYVVSCMNSSLSFVILICDEYTIFRSCNHDNTTIKIKHVLTCYRYALIGSIVRSVGQLKEALGNKDIGRTNSSQVTGSDNGTARQYFPN